MPFESGAKDEPITTMLSTYYDWFRIFFSIVKDKNISKSNFNFDIFKSLAVLQCFYKTTQTINNISYWFQGRIQELSRGGA